MTTNTATHFCEAVEPRRQLDMLRLMHAALLDRERALGMELDIARREAELRGAE